MSVENMKRAIGFNLTNPRAKPVLLALAWRAAENGESFAGHAQLSRDSGQSIPTVKRFLKDIAADGVLTVTNRWDNYGNPIRNLYRLHLPAASDQNEPTSAHSEPTPVHIDPTPGQRDPSSQVNMNPPSGQAELQKGKQRKDKGQGKAGPHPKSRLPLHWNASDVDNAYARDQGLDDGQIAFQAKAFRAHWHDPDAKNAEKSNWSTAWQKWILREIGFKSGVANLPRDHAPPPTSTVVSTPIKPGSPQWDAWRAYYVDHKISFCLKQMDAAADAGKPFYAPSEWPPDHQQQMMAA